MKKSLIATLVVAPLLSLSSMAFADAPAAAEPMLLTAVEMDGVTAGFYSFKFAQINQANVSPVTSLQLNVLSVGAGNLAVIGSGNSAAIVQ